MTPKQYTSEPSNRGTKRRSPPEILTAVHGAAEARGGRCLTDEYRPIRENWEFECERGHLFKTKADAVLHKGKWCDECKKAAMVERVHEAAEKDGGRCLNSVWKPTEERWSFRCSRGHLVKKRAQQVLHQGLFCRKCHEEDRYEEIKERAREQGGRVVTPSFKDLKEPWTFACQNGHTLERRGQHVLEHGFSCDKCVADEIFERMHKAAKDLGGKCLTDDRLSTSKKWKFECENGHTFELTGSHVLYDGNWCQQCREQEVVDALNDAAIANGGVCLTSEYRKQGESWSFRCEKGHRFKRTSAEVLQRNAWCPRCIGKDREQMLRKIRRAAKRRGGRCLNDEYMPRPEKMDFECARGHRWKAYATHILSANQWCPTCATLPSDEFLKKFEAVLKKRNGKMVRKSLGKLHEPHYFVCAEGHRFKQLPTKVVSAGHWCPKCSYEERAERQRLGIEEARRVAKDLGGECLAKEYTNAEEYAKWRCAEGHEWETKFKAVFGGTWCPECWDDQRRLGIEAARAAAEENGGECLAEEYTNADGSAWWRCAEGHEWETRFTNVIHQGTWCPTCARDRSHLVGNPRAEPRPLGIEDCQGLAERNGGICLNGYYVNYEHPMAWRCKRKHEWTASLRAMEFRENYCLECAEIERGQERMQEVHEWAGEYGGRCLTRGWTDNLTKMEWRCAQGHEWEASLHSMEQRDNFCSECAELERKNEWLIKAKAYADQNGGKCLSDEWVTAQSKLRWRCGKGHVFETSWNNAIVPPFCGQCAKEQAYQAKGAERLSAIATRHKGRWIESEYKGLRAKYEFEGKDGFRFFATPASAENSWEKYCQRAREAKT